MRAAFSPKVQGPRSKVERPARAEISTATVRERPASAISTATVRERLATEKRDRSVLCAAPCGPFRQNGPVPFFRRPGFSLAEIMVAIAILGIGLLMAAAAFPTGLDQTRVITELSTGPLVAREAANLIKRELAEFKQQLGESADWQCWRERWDQFVPLGVSPPGSGCSELEFEMLFKDIIDNLAVGDDEAELHIRAYPFGTPYESARYSWTPMMRFVTGTDVVQLLIFVNSGGQADELQLFNGDIKEDSVTGFQWLEVDVSNPQNANRITEGTLLVRRQDGKLIKVAARYDDPPSPRDNTAYFFLNGKVDLFGNSRLPIVAWILPVDPETGRAKVIGTYQYYLSL